MFFKKQPPIDSSDDIQYTMTPSGYSVFKNPKNARAIFERANVVWTARLHPRVKRALEQREAQLIKINVGH